MATTLYYGISGTTLTISGRSTSGASTQYVIPASGYAPIPPWYNYRNTITTLNFVNTPVINDTRAVTSGRNYLLFSNSITYTLDGVTATWYGCLAALKTITGTVDISGGDSTIGLGLFSGNPVETANLPNWKVSSMPSYFLWRNMTSMGTGTNFNPEYAATSSVLKSVNLKGWTFTATSAGYIGYALCGVLSNTLETLDLTGWKFLCRPSRPFRVARHDNPSDASTPPTYYGRPTNLKTLNLTNVAIVGTGNDWSEAFKDLTSLTTLTTTGMSAEFAVRYGESMFKGCSALTSVDLSMISTSALLETPSMFEGCSSLTSANLTGWNPRNDVSRMFYGCSKLATLTDFLGVAHTWITNATDMFYGCTKLTGSVNLSTWNCANLTQAAGMFDGCAALTSITPMALSLTTAARMFRGCSSLTTLNVTALDLSACTDISQMFYGCSGLTSLNAQGLTLTACTTMAGIFTGCVNLVTLNVSGWDTPALTNMDEVFAGLAKVTTLNLASWDTSYVTSMVGLFYNCTALTTVDISGFDTANVTNFAMASNNVSATFKPMFRGCDALTQVVLGASFTTAAAQALDDPANLMFYSRLELAPAVNLGNGVYVDSDGAFATLRTTEVAGTWRRGGQQMLSVFAYRSDNGEPDEQGLDITVDSTWRTSSTSSTRVLRIYIKDSTVPVYPTTPARTVTLSGDAGETVVTLSNVGSGNYDLRVEFYDGEITYVAFPSISTDTLLFSISPGGNVRILMNLEVSGGVFTLGSTSLTEAQLKSLLQLI